MQQQHNRVPHNKDAYNVEAWTPGSHHHNLVLPNLLSPGVRDKVLALNGHGMGVCAPLCDMAHALLAQLAGMVGQERIKDPNDPTIWLVKDLEQALNPMRLVALLEQEGVGGDHCLFLEGITTSEDYVVMKALGVQVPAQRVACFLKEGAPGQAHPPPIASPAHTRSMVSRESRATDSWGGTGCGHP